MNYCRICFCDEPSRDLNQLQSTQLNENDEKHSCEEIMLFCLGIQIVKGEKSEKLCEMCYDKIVEFYTFKVLALKNDAHLKSIDSKANIVDLSNNIKKEEVDHEQLSDEENYSQEEEPLIYIRDIKEYKQEDTSNEFTCVLKNEYVESEKLEPVKAPKNNQKKPRYVRRKTVKGNDEKVKLKAEPKKICDLCGKEVRDLNQHMQQHFPKEKKTCECDICGKTFKDKVTVKKHIHKLHFGSKEKCPICGKMVSALKAHTLTVHNKEKLPYECVPCGRRFLTKTRLAEHITMHTKDRPFQCEHCSQAYKTKAVMLIHVQRVHNKVKRHLCQFCSKRFFRKDQLKIHLRSHTKERPHECLDCGKWFSSSTTLKVHRKLHAGVNQYACTLCDMAFPVPNYLRAHMLSHSKEKKYPCRYCDMRYHRSDHRKRHEFTAHLRHTATNSADL